MLAGQGEELPRARRAGLAECLEQPLDHGPEHLVRLEVRRRPGQAGVAAVEQRGAELLQPVDGPAQQSADHCLGGGIGRQLIQITLDGGGSWFCVHDGSGLSKATTVPIVPG